MDETWSSCQTVPGSAVSGSGGDWGLEGTDGRRGEEGVDGDYLQGPLTPGIINPTGVSCELSCVGSSLCCKGIHRSPFYPSILVPLFSSER